MDKTVEEVDNFGLVTCISPKLNSFKAWQAPHEGLLSIGKTAQAITNNNLMYRSAQQNPLSIQDANLLKIHVQYCVKLIVPMVENLLSSAPKFNQHQTGGSFSEKFK